MRRYRVREMAPVKPLRIIRVMKPTGDDPAIMWHSAGGRRYRVEVSDTATWPSFREVVRPQAEELDPAPEGSASFQVFVDDESLAGARSASRFYRVREAP